MRTKSSRTNRFWILSITLLATAILSASLVTQGIAATNSKTSCASYHTVRANNTLKSIITTFHVRWQDLVSLNKLASPSYTIYVGQRLCLPKSKKDYDVPTGSAFKTRPANFTVARTNNNISISTSSFPKNNVFFVKVDDARASGITWYKLGAIRTGSKASGKYTFKLPSQLVKTSFFTVCVKNATTDILVCRNLVAGP